MDRDTLFPKLLADLYDNTGRPEDWPALLESLVAYVGGRAARLFIGTLDHPRHVTSAAVVGTDPAFLRLYVDRFAATDPRIGPLLTRIGQVTRGDEDLDVEAFDRTELVRECLDPGGVRHACGAMLAAGGPAKAWVAVLRPRAEGPFGRPRCAASAASCRTSSAAWTCTRDLAPGSPRPAPSRRCSAA